MYMLTYSEIPNNWHRPYKCQGVLEEFLSMHTPAVKLDIGDEWKNQKSAYSVLWKAAKRFGYPVKVRMVRGEVYLIRIGD